MRSLVNSFKAELKMINRRIQKTIASVWLLFLMAIHAYAGPIEPRSMDICVAVAREQLDLFVLDVKTLADRCECVGRLMIV